MSLPVKTFRAGDFVRVEIDGRIIGQVEKNPYYYVVEFQDGTQEQIYVERLHLIADRAKVLQETGCVKIISNRLSPAGALDLLQWLEIHRHELEEASAGQSQSVEVTQVTDDLTE